MTNDDTFPLFSYFVFYCFKLFIISKEEKTEELLLNSFTKTCTIIHCQLSL